MDSLRSKVSLLLFGNILVVLSVFSVWYYTDNEQDVNLFVFFILLMATTLLNLLVFEVVVERNIKKIKNSISKASVNNRLKVVDFSKLEKESSIKEFREIQFLIEKVKNNLNEKEKEIKIKDTSIQKIHQKIDFVLKENKKIAINLKNELVGISKEASNQITNTENTEKSVSEMVNGIKSINDTVGVLSKNAQIAIENAKKGNENLEKVVSNMNEIQQNAEDSVVTIDDLGRKIKEIQVIVDVINSLSSRTNLLALNATIEAEKAVNGGDSSDGFIVVSEEIKKLAEKSSTSTIEIEKIAKLIINNKDRTIEQIDKNRNEVRKGISVVNEASKSFNSILRSTNEIGLQLSEVTTSSEQLDRSTEEIIDKISRNNENSKEFIGKIKSVEDSLLMNIKSIDEISALLFEIEGIKK